jgi:hypothetical protein
MVYLMVNHRTPQGIVTLFARKDDGMVVGRVAGTIVQIGDDPGAMIARGFMDRDSAVTWMRKQLTIRQLQESTRSSEVEVSISFEERDGDPLVNLATPNLRM